MKKTIIVVFALVWCQLSIAVPQSAKAKLIKQNPWDYLKAQLIERPRQKVAAYSERNVNRGVTTLLWLGAMVSHLCKPCIQKQCEEAMCAHIQVCRNEEYNETTQRWICLSSAEALDAAERNYSLWLKGVEVFPRLCKAMAFCASLFTIWTIYRNRVALLRRAEKECLIELLEVWEQKKQCVPTVVRFHLEQLVPLFAQQPKKFHAQAPTVINFLKQKIRENTDI